MMKYRYSDSQLVGLSVAAGMLRERYPEYVVSRHQLRRWCIGRTLRCVTRPRGKVCAYMVRVRDVVDSIRSNELYPEGGAA